MSYNVCNARKAILALFCKGLPPQIDMGGKTGNISQRVPASVTRKLKKLSEITGWSESDLLSELVWTLSDHVATTGEKWYPYRMEPDADAAERMKLAREEHMVILREPDPERQIRMLVGMLKHSPPDVDAGAAKKGPGKAP